VVAIALGCSGGGASDVGGGAQVTTTPEAPPSDPRGPVPSGHPSSTGAGGSIGAPGSAGTTGAAGSAGETGAAGTTGAAGAAGAGMAGAGGAPVGPPRNWPTVDCVGGPCAAPNLCVDLDFLFVACVPCGGNDDICCPPDPNVAGSLGTCDPGLVCAPNPNFQSSPPTDLVQNVCQIPGMPPIADFGLNHQRLRLFP